jgi:hypothetical protein
MRAIILPFLLLGAAGCVPGPGPGTLLLSNIDFGPTRVEAVVTANPDCSVRDDGYVGTGAFVLPVRGTRFIAAPPGADVCWRRDLDPDNPAAGKWTDWARAYLAPGRIVDSTL